METTIPSHGARPERKDGGHPALCNAPPQWLRMRHQSHPSHQMVIKNGPFFKNTAGAGTGETHPSPPLPFPLTTAPRHMPAPCPSLHLPFGPLCNATPLPSLEIVPGRRSRKGATGSYCGAALHRRCLMVPASAQLGARPERKDGGHPTSCNAPPQWLRMRH